MSMTPDTHPRSPRDHFAGTALDLYRAQVARLEAMADHAFDQLEWRLLEPITAPLPVA